MGDKRGIAVTSQNIGQFYYSAKRFNEAKPFYNNALKCAQEIKDLEISKNVSFDLFNLYDQIGNSAKALEIYKLHNAYRDSVSNSMNLQRLTELQSLYEINVKEKEIELLKSNNENNALKISSQRRLILFAVIAIALMVALCVTILIGYRKNKHANTLLQKTFSIIAHDLRSPIASLCSLTEMLNQTEIELDDKERKAMIEQTEKMSQAALEQLDEILKARAKK